MFPTCEGSDFVHRQIKEFGQNAHGGKWHFDGSYFNYSFTATILFGVETPPDGHTMLASTYSSYSELSDETKALIEPLKAYHLDGYYTYPAFHPLIGTHPVTQKKCLLISDLNRMYKIVGKTEEESRPILEDILKVATGPKHVCSYKWKAGNILIWDNRCTMHKSGATASTKRRHHMRACTSDDPADLKLLEEARKIKLGISNFDTKTY
eukprot:NODE_5162_length_1057_cov_43.077088_g4605_i0.p1 GENE.NODE_5162_length_1057_cov_43.077088_g4605_i0~~NODE_5162_length_1057_cov_43.077088_g4605_i0.p1  ORF type:complete len:209 (-),score=41.98 NODE_5162_length_1057_cov_43.077088_g4605_i0:109-735(-)